MKEPILDNEGLLANDPKNGITVVNEFNCMDWIEYIKTPGNRDKFKNSLFQFTYDSATNPSGETTAYFVNPIIFNPISCVASKDSINGFKGVTQRVSKGSFLDAVAYFAEAEEKLYNGLVKRAKMTRNEALDFIDHNYAMAIGAVDLDKYDVEVLKLFKQLTADAREMLATNGKIEWSKETRQTLLNAGVNSSLRSNGVTVDFVRSYIHALNVTNVIGHGVNSRGSLDRLLDKKDREGNPMYTEDSVRQNVVGVINGDDDATLTKEMRTSTRNYTVYNIFASGEFKVIEFKVEDWDTFFSILEWYHKEDTVE